MATLGASITPFCTEPDLLLASQLYFGIIPPEKLPVLLDRPSRLVLRAARRHHLPEFIQVGTSPQRIVQGNDPSGHQTNQTLVHGLHAEFFLPHLHLRIYLVDLVLPDQVPDRWVGYHDFQGQCPAGAPNFGDKGLGKDPFKNEGELGPHLCLLIRGENVDYTVDGLHAGVGVQGGETEMAGFGDHQRRLDGFKVAHFTDEDNIGVLAENVFQGSLETLGVSPHFTLIDQTSFMGMQILYRVFNGNDMFMAVGINPVDDRRQGR